MRGQIDHRADPTHATGLVYLYMPAMFRYLTLLGESVEAILKEAAGIQPDEAVAYQARLAMHETCTNIIEHAYRDQGGYIQACLFIEQEPARLVVDFYDTGHSFSPDLVAKPDLAQAQTSGYGLFLINALMDEVIYEARPGENHWRLVKTLTTTASPT